MSRRLRAPVAAHSLEVCRDRWLEGRWPEGRWLEDRPRSSPKERQRRSPEGPRRRSPEGPGRRGRSPREPQRRSPRRRRRISWEGRSRRLPSSRRRRGRRGEAPRAPPLRRRPESDTPPAPRWPAPLLCEHAPRPFPPSRASAEQPAFPVFRLEKAGKVARSGSSGVADVRASEHHVRQHRHGSASVGLPGEAPRRPPHEQRSCDRRPQGSGARPRKNAGDEGAPRALHGSTQSRYSIQLFNPILVARCG
jgi:hypothetical protein